MKSATLSEARAAKAKLQRSVAQRPEVNGIGITRGRGGYAIKLNLSEDVVAEMPAEVDGVPVRIEVVGAISKRATARRRSA